MFESLQMLPPDAILGVIAEHAKDSRPYKIDLGVGVYRTAEGETPVLATVKEAERRLLETQQTKAYIGTAGAPDFNAAMQALTFADSAPAERLVSLQAPGGSGALRVAAGIILRARKDATVWVSKPTWANHVPLLGGAGIKLESYPYYDTKRHVLEIDAMLEALRAAPAGDIVLLHACCHNPSGLDPSESEWQAIADVVVERGLIPFIDIAYHGLGTSFDRDALAVRHFAGRVDEMIVCSSCSKNFGLYRDRVGLVSLLARDASAADILRSNANNYVRTLYSVPPDHGAAVVAIILGDPELREQWLGEVAEMRDRLNGMSRLLNDKLVAAAPDHDFSHLVRTKGMFCFLGITAEQVGQLKRDHAVYMVDSSRINVAGITPANVDHLAKSIAAVL